MGQHNQQEGGERRRDDGRRVRTATEERRGGWRSGVPEPTDRGAEPTKHRLLCIALQLGKVGRKVASNLGEVDKHGRAEVVWWEGML